MWPGLVMPFLNHPMYRLVLLGAFVWLILRFFVMLKSKKPWQLILNSFIFPLPVLFLPMLGPAVITVITLIWQQH